jgi:hypothetical protein
MKEIAMNTREPELQNPARAITVAKSTEGWEVRETNNSTVVRSRKYTDWHRVERAVQVFEFTRH